MIDADDRDGLRLWKFCWPLSMLGYMLGVYSSVAFDKAYGALLGNHSVVPAILTLVCGVLAYLLGAVVWRAVSTSQGSWLLWATIPVYFVIGFWFFNLLGIPLPWWNAGTVIGGVFAPLIGNRITLALASRPRTAD